MCWISESVTVEKLQSRTKACSPEVILHHWWVVGAQDWHGTIWLSRFAVGSRTGTSTLLFWDFSILATLVGKTMIKQPWLKNCLLFLIRISLKWVLCFECIVLFKEKQTCNCILKCVYCHEQVNFLQLKQVPFLKFLPCAWYFVLNVCSWTLWKLPGRYTLIQATLEFRAFRTFQKLSQLLTVP